MEKCCSIIYNVFVWVVSWLAQRLKSTFLKVFLHWGCSIWENNSKNIWGQQCTASLNCTFFQSFAYWYMLYHHTIKIKLLFHTHFSWCLLDWNLKISFTYFVSTKTLALLDILHFPTLTNLMKLICIYLLYRQSNYLCKRVGKYISTSQRAQIRKKYNLGKKQGDFFFEEPLNFKRHTEVIEAP